MKNSAYLSLGSNLSDRRAFIASAVERLAKLGKVLAISSLYETEPMEVTDQPWFLNCALALTTELTPGQLMDSILEIERNLGRRRRTRAKGPREIDIDILLYADATVNQPGLTIPHPAMHGRRFVLEPLAEIAPELQHPTLKRSVLELKNALPPGPVVKRI